MGLLDFFKKKAIPEERKKDRALLAMPLFESGHRYDIQSVIDCLRKEWNLRVKEGAFSDDTAVLSVEGETVAIAYIPLPVPEQDIKQAVQYAYNWEGAAEAVSGISGHALVTVMHSQQTVFRRALLLSKVVSAILSTSESVGVYKGSQTLLVRKEQYLEYGDMLRAGKAPVPLWVYIGIRTRNEGNNIYTFGLSEFGKQELEVINSKMAVEDIYNFVLNICSYVIQSDVVLKSGETLGYTPDQKVKIIASRGLFTEGEVLRLEM